MAVLDVQNGGFRVQNVIEGGADRGSGIRPLRDARLFASTHNITRRVIKDNMITTTEGMRIFPQLMSSSQRGLRILDGSRDCDNQNNDSIVVLARFRQASFLFT